MSTILHCLPGFLGLASDWQSVFDTRRAPTGLRPVTVAAVDVLSGELVPCAIEMPQWARRFNDAVASACARTDEGGPVKNVLLGYSLGGRLALHALLDAPSFWDATIIVAAHPGLDNEADKESRRRSDEGWARRFECEPWSTLIPAWNALEVFGGRPAPFDRREDQFSRANLAHALRYWSLANQQNLLPELARLNLPVLWIAGSEDEKFRRIAHTVKNRAPHIHVREIAGAAHRVPWEDATAFLSAIDAFLHEHR